MLHLRGGKVEPGDDRECQAEDDGDGFAALGHICGVTSLALIASLEPELSYEISPLFS